jgi:hypothetical protein
MCTSNTAIGTRVSGPWHCIFDNENPKIYKAALALGYKLGWRSTGEAGVGFVTSGKVFFSKEHGMYRADRALSVDELCISYTQSLNKLVEFLQPKTIDPIEMMVGTHKVQIFKNGDIVFGCSKVARSIVDDIIEKRNKIMKE